MNTERKMVMKEVGIFTTPEHNTLGEMLTYIHEYIGKFGADAVISEEYYEYGDGETYFAIKKDMPETDLEMGSRITSEELRAKNFVEHELAEFARLSKKFNKVSK